MSAVRAPEPQRIASQAYTTDIILLDIVAYSLLPNEKQYLALYYLNRIIRNITRLLELHYYVGRERIVQGVIPTGDGCYLILNPRIAGYGPLFALFLRNLLLFNNRLLDDLFNGVRTGVHHGAVIPIDFFDTANFVGDGLNTCSLLLGRTASRKARRWFYRDDNIVVISDAAWAAFERLFPPRRRSVRAYLERIGFSRSRPYSLRDKHQRAAHRIRFIDSAKVTGSAPPRPEALPGG